MQKPMVWPGDGFRARFGGSFTDQRLVVLEDRVLSHGSGVGFRGVPADVKRNEACYSPIQPKREDPQPNLEPNTVHQDESHT
jgi:hypothetical protein